jgi:hypothetical protein
MRASAIDDLDIAIGFRFSEEDDENHCRKAMLVI